MKWALMPLRRYAEFHGRSRRREFWSFALLVFVLGLVLGTFDSGTVGGPGDYYWVGNFYLPGPFSSLLGLLLFLPSLAVGVRRLHDSERSGWWMLLNLIPAIGALILLILMLLPGTPGSNRYGPDPKLGADIRY